MLQYNGNGRDANNEGWRSSAVSHHRELTQWGSSHEGGETRKIWEPQHKQGGWQVHVEPRNIADREQQNISKDTFLTRTCTC